MHVIFNILLASSCIGGEQSLFIYLFIYLFIFHHCIQIHIITKFNNNLLYKSRRKETKKDCQGH